MSDLIDRLSQLSPKRLALLALELQEKLDAAEGTAHEPIAIVGMACRLPGADDLDGYWELLRDGVDAIDEIPGDRWDADAYYDPDPDVPGKMATRWGGFLHDIDRFEPQMFGIAPREARTLDPQQRLLLEVAWEALEHAGIAPDSLQGSATGVYVGLCNGDYGQLLMETDSDELDMYVSTGNATSVASGRLSYVLGLQGPAMTVDTACSSSLVALHLAVRGLREGACRAALAGGVNVILSPKTTMTLSRAKMMASDGRCKAFDASGDGFVRGEGCGLVVLKRQSDAVADGDRVLAVIRGSATNQDGRSNGLTAPNGPSQVAVIRAAIADAGVEPSEVGYVEAHGTGTSLGDPIEAQALGAALGLGRGADERLLVGSAKTNLGHLESAAGIAGLMKVVLSLQHGEIPPSLHFREPNPHIPWDRLPIDIVTSRTPWPGGEGSRIAGVSSFGFSGTNAHVVVEAAPEPDPPSAEHERPSHLLKLAASGDVALHDLAGRVAAHLGSNASQRFADVAFTANVGRSELPDRLAVVADDAIAARRQLEAFAAGESADGLVVGTATGQRVPPVAFLFTGHGSQYPDMGRALYDTQPVYREAIDRCADGLVEQMDRPLLDVLLSDRPDAELGRPLLDSMAYAQPALFAVEYALAELWRSWGVTPTVVAGHSAGEYVAAVVAGAMSLQDGLRLIAARGRLMASLPPDGEMATVFATEERVRQVLDSCRGNVSIAAVNGPESVALSGTGGDLTAVLEVLRADGVEVRPLAIPIAAHSPQVDPILDEFESVAASVEFSAPRLDVVSGMTGALADGDDLVSAGYWRRHLRQPVRFADALQTIYDQGTRIFVEIGPHPTLLNIGRHVLPEHECAWLPSLRSGHDDWTQVLHSAGELWVRGVPLDWAGFDAPYERRKLALPTYPFQRQRYWMDGGGRRGGRTPGGHPLLGHQVRSPLLDAFVFESELSATWPAFLDHHRIFGTVLLPSPAYVEMALTAAGEVLSGGPFAVEHLSIREALILPEEAERTLQLIIDPHGGGATFQFFSRAESDSTWTLHATGNLVAAADDDGSTEPFDPATVRERCGDHIDGAAYYARLHGLGLEFGSGFQGVAEIWRRDGEALARVERAEALGREASHYGIHPAMLDACFHVLGAPMVADDEDNAYLLIGIDRFRLHAEPGTELWNHTVLRDGFEDIGSTFSGDIRLYDTNGRLVAEALGLQLKHATRDALMRAARQQGDDWLYEVEWQRRTDDAERDLPAVEEVLAPLGPTLAELGAEHDLERYDALMRGLDELATVHVIAALDALGVPAEAGRRFGTDELAEDLGVAPRHRRLFARLLTVAADAGRLRPDGDGWEVCPAAVVPTASAADLRAAFPGADAEVTLVERCGASLTDVLRGTTEPLDLLFPGGSQDTTEAIYRDAPAARVVNALVGDAVAAIARALPDDRPVRVLELGAGTGATTASVLDRLPAGRSEYWFTDISPSFTARAEERWGGLDGFRTGLLDIERDPAAQGVPGGHFDVVVAANVLHATSDLGESLANIGSVLAPGGLLLLVEGVRTSPWVDITFGLTEGWWRFADTDLRPDHPLLDRAAWLDLLSSRGFRQADTPSGAQAGDAVGQVLLVAGAPEAGADERTDRSWLLLGSGGGLAASLSAILEEAGEPVTRLDAASPIEEVRRSVELAGTTTCTVVHLAALDVPPIEATGLDELAAATLDATASALHAARAVVTADTGAELWLVTRGAQPALGSVEAPEQATLWGLGRVIGLEHPERWGGLVDLGAGSSPDDAAALLAEIRAGGVEDQVALRDGERLVPRLVRRSAPTAPPVTWHADGSYLITGGLGGLGLKLARWMAVRGAGSIVLIGRRGLPERERWDTLDPGSREASQVAAVRAVEQLGTNVTVIAADVADPDAIGSVFDRFGGDLPPLRGVIHAAAALSDWSIAEMPTEALADMLRPKVEGTWLLHRLTEDLPLDFFVLFSTTTALWGSRDLGHYAAANQFLDALAHHRHDQGLPALSINWGTWDEMRVASTEEQQLVASSGLHPMPSDAALQVLEDVLGDPDLVQVTVASVDWSVLKPIYELRRERPFLSHVADRRTSAAPPRVERVPELTTKLAGAQPQQHREIVVEFLREQVASALGARSVNSIDVDQGLFEMGMDSLMSVELKGSIEVAVGMNLPSTLTFNYPNIGALADFLISDALASIEPEPDVPGDADIDQAGGLDRGAEDDAPVGETDDLEEDELADLLAARLARLRSEGSS